YVNSFLKSKSSYAKALGLLSIVLQVYLLGYLMEINSESLQTMIFWNKIQYFGIPFFPALWLMVSMLYTGRGRYLQGLGGFVIFAVPLTTFIVRMTNDWHHLYYTDIELQYFLGMKLMLLSKGPWYLVQTAYVLIILILCTLFYFQRYRKSIGYERMQFRLLLIGSVLPYIALILSTINIGEVGIDYTALMLPPCILLINLALTRYNFMEIKVLARDRVFEDGEAGLILLNRFYRIVDFNAASVLFLKWFDVQIIKEEQLELLLKDQKDLLDCIKGSEDNIFHLIVEGEARYVSVNVRYVQNEEEKAGLLITLEDVTERELLKQRLIEMASIDELSGLNNRRRFREYAEAAFQRALRYHEHVSVLMLDIDYFKRINDSFGHLIGDDVIRTFSEMLSAAFRGTDIVGRMGGEEFAVVMLNSDAAKACQKAEHFRQAVEGRNMSFGQQQINVTVSIGVAEFSEETPNLDALINRADSALYEAKRNGRNCTVIDKANNGSGETMLV
ncbi:MAG TPA: diguanylate cyclase, partial [Negativicutes bacterium]|nr:diguanylate cyclase [Negativicutes bacterium]